MTSAGSDTGDFILLGKVTKPHGIRGEVKVYPYSGQPENFLDYREVFFTFNEGERIPYTVEKSRVQGKLVILKLKECTTRNQAEEMIGHEIWLNKNDLADLDDDEYYWHDLVGKRVATKDGDRIGTIKGILETGAHDILAIEDQGREYLVPFNEAFVVTVDDTEVVLDLPPGLLEINRK